MRLIFCVDTEDFQIKPWLERDMIRPEQIWIGWLWFYVELLMAKPADDTTIDYEGW